MKKKYQLAALIVTYNPDLVLLEKQFTSIVGQLEFVCVVDNNSINIQDVIQLLNHGKFTFKFHIINFDENIGLGFAQNSGLDYLKEIGVTDVLLLDQDSVLSPNFCRNLLDDRDYLITQGINLGVIGPSYFDALSNQSYPITKYKGPFIQRIFPSTFPVEATFVISSGSLISMDVFNNVGGVNGNLFIDYLDVEWCFRLKKMGYAIYVSANAKMNHMIGESRLKILGRSISVHSPIRRYYLVRNSIFMVRLAYVPLGYKLREIFLNLFRISILLFTQKNKIGYLKYFLLGVKDGFLGKYGKFEKNNS